MQVPDWQKVESSRVLEIPGLQDSKVAGLQGSKVTRLQESKVAGFHGFKAPRFQSSGLTGFQNRNPLLETSQEVLEMMHKVVHVYETPHTRVVMCI